jgi:hypothetical protein
MKNFTKIVVVALCALSLNACILVSQPANKGKHKGWYKKENPAQNQKSNSDDHQDNDKHGRKQKGKKH